MEEDAVVYRVGQLSTHHQDCKMPSSVVSFTRHCSISKRCTCPVECTSEPTAVFVHMTLEHYAAHSIGVALRCHPVQHCITYGNHPDVAFTPCFTIEHLGHARNFPLRHSDVGFLVERNYRTWQLHRYEFEVCVRVYLQWVGELEFDGLVLHHEGLVVAAILVSSNRATSKPYHKQGAYEGTAEHLVITHRDLLLEECALRAYHGGSLTQQETRRVPTAYSGIT